MQKSESLAPLICYGKSVELHLPHCKNQNNFWDRNNSEANSLYLICASSMTGIRTLFLNNFRKKI